MDGNIFWPGSGLIRGLIVLLGGLFAFGLWLSGQALWQIGRERRAAQALRKRNAQGLILDPATVQVQLGAYKDTLAGRLLRSMIGQRGLAFARPSDSLDPILDGVSRILAPARTLPNLLLLLGLIGTVVGLALTLVSLGPQIQKAITAGQPQAVAQSLGVTLGEMSGAFAGTLWGVLSAFVLQGINAWTGVQSEKLSGELDELALHYAPTIYPGSTEQQVTSLQEILQNSRQFLGDTQQQISTMSKEFASVLERAGGTIEKSLSTLETTTQQISSAMLEASGNVAQSSDKLNTAVKAIQGHREDFRNIYSQFNEMFERSMSALKTHSDGELQAIRDMQAEFGKTGAEIVKEIFGTSERFNQLSADIAQAESNYLGSAQAISNTIGEGFKRLNDQIGETLGRYTTEVGAVSSQLDGLGKEIQDAQAASRALTQMLKAKDDAERTRMKDQHQHDQLMLVANSRLTTSLEQLAPAVAELNPSQLLKELGEQQAQAAERQIGAVQAVREVLQVGHDRQLVASDDLGDKMQDLALLLTGLLDQLAQQTEGLQSQVAGTTQLHEAFGAHAVGSRERGAALETRIDEASRRLGEQLQARHGTEEQQQAALHLALEQSRDAALGLTRTLDALPAQLRSSELIDGQQALSHVLGRLVTDLGRGMVPAEGSVPAEGTGQPA